MIVAAAAICAGALVWSRAGYVPMWDGRIYADCFIDAATQPFRIDAYRCGNHVSHAYAAIVALAQRTAPYSPLPMLVANAFLFTLAAVAFWRILAGLFPDLSHSTARALTTAAFLVHPVVLGALVQPGLDFGVLVFALCVIAAALEGRVRALALAGSLLVFSKEPGLLIYAVVATFHAWRAALPDTLRWPTTRAGLLAAGSFLVVYNVAPFHPAVFAAAAAVSLGVLLLTRPRRVVGRKEIADVARRLARLWPLVVPVALFVAYAAYRIYAHAPGPAAASVGQPAARASVVWGSDSARLLADMFLRLEADPFARSALALVFVVGFLWIPSAIIGVDAVVGAARAAARRAPRAVPGANEELVAFVLAMTAALTWTLTRYETFSNARYYLPVYPLLLIASCCALVRLGVPRRVREVVIATVAVLLAISATRTVDPVSRRLWGTFRFGDRDLLRVTAITRECCGYGRDQLAYNLEFTALADVQDALYARLRPTDKTALVMHDYANLFTVGPLDVRSGRRTLRRAGLVHPAVVPASLVTHSSMRIADGWTAWFVAFPNMDNTEPLAALRGRFEVGPALWATTRDGYAMAAYPLRHR
ncbi:MAG: hypothetical protein M3282_05280 [Gemmatimonadota bacterium]|nr:hypothetical protein [Gemmatimonadota bacterium]